MVEESELPNKDFKLTYFSNEEEIYKFAKNNEDYLMVKTLIENTRKIRTLAEKTGDINLDDPSLDNISIDMKELLASFNTQNKTSVVGHGFVFDGANATGKVGPMLGLPQPFYGKFRNKASSARGLGLINALHDKTWFRGQTTVVVLNTFIPWNLAGWGFDNRAESSF